MLILVLPKYNGEIDRLSEHSGEVYHRVRKKETLLSPDIPEKDIIQIFIGVYSLPRENGAETHRYSHKIGQTITVRFDMV